MGPRVYIHEFIDIRGHNRARYLQHMTANWVPIGRRERAQSCFGVWAVVGSTGRWPQVVNLWEYDGWGALGRNFDVELRGGGLQDPSLAEWWAAAADLRSGGFDRILVAPDWSPSVSDHEASGATNAAGYLHELIAALPGASGEVLDAVRDAAVPGYRVPRPRPGGCVPAGDGRRRRGRRYLVVRRLGILGGVRANRCRGQLAARVRAAHRRARAHPARRRTPVTAAARPPARRERPAPIERLQSDRLLSARRSASSRRRGTRIGPGWVTDVAGGLNDSFAIGRTC
ncbi:MAG: hypothetical protein IPG46_08250 [Actinobacteria bacterium]|nr:hypothetical protein [Actinomycetota bacterium]